WWFARNKSRFPPREWARTGRRTIWSSRRRETQISRQGQKERRIVEIAVDKHQAKEAEPRITRSHSLLVSLSPCLLVSLSALAAGCELPGRPNPADRPKTEEQVLQFGDLFKQNCAGCHGAQGKLGPAPPLNDSLFRAIVPEKELETVITMGREETPM